MKYNQTRTHLIEIFFSKVHVGHNLDIVGKHSFFGSNF